MVRFLLPPGRTVPSIGVSAVIIKASIISLIIIISYVLFREDYIQHVLPFKTEALELKSVRARQTDRWAEEVTSITNSTV